MCPTNQVGTSHNHMLEDMNSWSFVPAFAVVIAAMFTPMIQLKDLIESSIPLGFPTPKYIGPIGAGIMTLNTRHPTFHPGCQAWVG